MFSSRTYLEILGEERTSIWNTIKQCTDLEYRVVMSSAEGDMIYQRICEVRTSSAYLDLPRLTSKNPKQVMIHSLTA
jgi:hypothetical protein